MNFISTFLKLFDLLSRVERRQSALLLCLILFMSFLEAVGVLSVFPFFAVLANPQLIDSNPILKAAYDNFGFDSQRAFLFALGFAVVFLLVISLVIKALTIFFQTKFALMREYAISKRLVEGYLHQPYIWFLNQHSADLGKNILSQVGVVIGNALLPMINLIVQSAVAFSLLMVLLFVDAVLAITVGFVLGMSYVVVLFLTKGLIDRLGKLSFNSNHDRFMVVNEAFSATKEIKLSGLESIYIERFSLPAKVYAKTQATASIIGQLPRFFFEAIAFGGMLVLTLILMYRGDDGLNAALPIIVLYAFAGYRLMPALQQIYGAFTQIRFASHAVNLLHSEVRGLNVISTNKLNTKKISVNSSIKLRNVVFRYPNSSNDALKGLNIDIPANQTIGFVGSSGSGKSTTIDLILALLNPAQGELRVDGECINSNNLRRWQSTIGYVPQQIYLVDDTILANIAFGVPYDEVILENVERASKIACIHDFVTQKLPHGYSTKVGERGLRLSGGQRQRIGIARALYHNPSVLVLDEATSALDTITEKAVMSSLKNLGDPKTIILVAHRLTTLKECNKIYLMDQGELIDSGTYEELQIKNPIFRKMSGGS